MKYLALLFCLFVGQVSISQNLVSNGGFETFTLCPDDFGQLYRATDWVNPNASSPDYLNRCSFTGSVGVPNNDFGYQQPHGGDAYVGISLYEVFPGNFREYIQTRLLRPLVSGMCYRLEMYVNLGENYSKYSTDDWGAYFSVLPLTNIQSMINFTVTPQIINTPGNYPDFANWKLCTEFFYANGGEEYLTIGNFKSNVNTDTVQIITSTIWSSIYMYIDDVSLTECRDVKIQEQQAELEAKVFPTVFKDEIHAELHPNDNAELTIYNQFGEIIASKKFKGSCSIETESWHSDIYFYQLRTEVSLISKGKLIKE